MFKKKNSLGKLILFVIVAVPVIYVLAVIITLNAYRFKVTDPKDPRFNAENFRFEDYFLNRETRLGETKLAIFKPGTDRSFVEHLMVDKNNTNVHPMERIGEICSDVEAVTQITYGKIPWWNFPVSLFAMNLTGYSFHMTVCYDKDNKVLKVS